MSINRKNERPVFLVTEGLEFGITPDRQISVRLGKPHPDLGMAPDLVFALEFSPDTARSIAQVLLNKAREAEGGQSQH